MATITKLAFMSARWWARQIRMNGKLSKEMENYFTDEIAKLLERNEKVDLCVGSSPREDPLRIAGKLGIDTKAFPKQTIMSITKNSIIIWTQTQKIIWYQE